MRRNLIVIKYLMGVSLALIAISNCFNVLSNSSFFVTSRPADVSRTEAAKPEPGRLTAPSSVGDKLDGGNSLFLNSSLNSANRRSTSPVARLHPASAASPFAASLTATKTDNISTPVNLGDTIMYTVEITNTGDANATNVNFTDTLDANTTLVVGSVKVAPIAVDDSYNTIGNVNITIPAPQGVINNPSGQDFNPNGSGTLEVTQVNATAVPSGGMATAGTTHGSVTMHSDGSFDYTPNAGFAGPTDTFTYTLGNGTGKTDTATVTINISGLIWFVNNSPGPAGDGRLNTPFRNLVGGANPLTGTVANDVIFIYTGSGNYTGGLTLTSGEKVIGQGATQSILVITGFSAPSGTNLLPATGGTNPVITGSNITAITLGSNNGLHGFTIGDTGASGTDISGSAFGTLTAKKITLNGTGRALNLSTGTFAAGATFDLIESNGGSSNEGLRLNAVGGSFTATTTNIVNPTGTGIDVQNAPSGTSFSFGGTTVNKGSSSGTGVNLNTNVGTFSFSSLAVTTSSGTGVSATSSGTVNVTTGSISATGGPALVSNPTALGMTFTTVSSTNSSTTGISLTSVSGSVSIGTTTITNPTGIGISVNTSSATLGFGNTNSTQSGGAGVSLITNTGAITFGSLDISPDSGQVALIATDNTMAITATSGTITATSAQAINIDGPAGRTPIDLAFNAITGGGSNSVSIVDASGTKFTVSGTTQINSRTGTGIFISNVTTPTIQFNTTNIPNPSSAGGYGIRVQNSSAAVTIATATISSPTVTAAETDADADFFPENDGDGDGIFLTTNTGSFTLNGGTISNAGGEGIDARSASAITLSGVTISNPGGNGYRALNVTGTNSVTNCTITSWNTANKDAMRVANSSTNLTAMTIGGTTFSNSTTGSAALSMKAVGTAQMTMTVQSACQFTSIARNGINVTNQGGWTGTMNVTVQNSTFTSVATSGLFNPINIAPFNGAGTCTFNVTGNTINTSGTVANATGLINLLSGATSAANGPKVTATVSGNTIPSSTGFRGINFTADTFAGQFDVTVNSNMVTNVAQVGINISIRDSAGSAAASNSIKVQSNTVNVGGGASNNFDGLVVEVRGAAKTVNTVIGGTNVSSGNSLTADRQFETLYVTAENSATHNVTIQNNTIAQSNAGAVGLEVFTITTAPTMCINVLSNTFTGASHGLRLDRINGTMNVKQASLAAVQAANPGSSAADSGAPTYNSACTAPTAASVGGEVSASSLAEPLGYQGGSVSDVENLLVAAGGEVIEEKETPNLTDWELSRISNAAIERWAAMGISYEDLGRLRAVQFKIDDLAGGSLASATSNTIVIDATAAGYGWFVDATPGDDSEFESSAAMDEHKGKELMAAEGNASSKRMDLLTAVMHALGVVLKHDKSTIMNMDEVLMTDSLPAGVRRLPEAKVGKISRMVLTDSAPDAGQGDNASSPTPVAKPSQTDDAQNQATSAAPEASSTGNPVASAAPSEPTTDSASSQPNTDSFTSLPDLKPAVFNPSAGLAPGAYVRSARRLSYVTGARPNAAANPMFADMVNLSLGTIPPGKKAVIMFSVTVNNSVPANTTKVCNQGQVSANSIPAFNTDDPDTGAANDATCTQLNVADLSVTKTDAPDPVIAGNNITYTVVVTNGGPITAANVTLSDVVPANTTFVSTTTPAGWTRNDSTAVGGTGTLAFSKPSMTNGETATFTIVVKVNSNVANGTTITNSATTATTTPDPTANNTATATTTVNAQADLAVTKTDSPDPVDAGSNITYTINFTNNGPSDAQTVTVTDAVPANTTFVSAVVTTGSGWAVNTSGPIVFSKATVAPGETAVFTMVVQVNANAAHNSTITNSATAASATTDPTPGNNTGTATTTVRALADLAVTKTDSPDPVIAGNNITYTINFTNNGPSSAGNVTVTDATPANTTFVSAAITTGPGWSITSQPVVGGTGNVVFSKASVANGETAVFTIIVKVNSSTANGATITNSVTAASTNSDPDNSNNTATTTTTVNTQADLAVTKTDSPDPVIAGNNITYTINFTNNGPSDAQTVTVTDAVPANTTFVSAVVTTGSGWAVNTSGPIVFSKNPVPAGETAVFTIVVKVNSNTADGTSISNTATAATTTTDPTSGNNSSTATTVVQARADLIVTKSDSPDPVNAGGNITYTINFSNAGPSDAQTVTVSDAVPAGTTFVSAMVTTGVGWAVNTSGPIVFSKGTVLAGESAVFTIIVSVPTSTANGTTISNTAAASSATTDPVPGNNMSTAVTTVQASADLAVTKTDLPDPGFAGANITYTIGLTNNGPSDAQSVTLSDAVPTNTTFVSATFPAGWSRTDSVVVGGTGTLTFTKPTVAAGETASFTIIVKVDASTSAGTIISNTATATTTTTDPVSGNNSATATTTIQTQADLAITKTASPTPTVIAGNNITYTLNLINNGAGAATSVTVSDPTPTNTTLVSVTTPAGWTRTDVVAVGGTGTITFTKASVADAETATFTIVVKVNSGTASGATITNTATVTSATGDPNTNNNMDVAMTNVIRRIDLAVTKTDAPDPVIAGSNITYTINFSNAGPSDASNVTVTDTLPAGTSLVSAVVTTGAGWATTTPAGQVVFSKAAVTAGESAVFTIIVSVPSSTANGATINNSVTAAATETDTDNSNNTATASTGVITRADLVVTKSDSPDPVNAGGNLTYTINFSNAGPSDAQTVTVSDAVPAGTTFVSATVTTGVGWAVNTSGPIVFSKATVVAGETAVFTIIVSVPASTASGTVINNSATASSATTDPVPGNNTGTAMTTVQTRADLAVTKSDTPDPVNAGGNITYTINFVNNGPSDAQTVTVSDAVPANTTFVSATVTTGSGWSTNTAGPIVFSKATVAAGETAVFTIVVKVNANTPSGTIISNSATAATATTDPTSGNNTATATTTVQVQADLAITKSDSPDPVIAGNNLTYTINLTNNGPSDASTVSVSDAVPAGTTFVSATVITGSGWATNTAGPIVFSKATVVNGETATFQIVVKVNANVANGTTITNMTTVTSTSSDGTPGNNSATATTTVNTQADLAVTKSDSPDPVIAGNNLTYTINFTNNGPSDAQTVTVSDAVPAGTTFVSATVTTGTGWSTNTAGPIVFSKATVAAGETAVFTMVVKVNSNVANGSTINNSAVAASATTDPTPGNNTGTASTSVIARVDLAVTKSDSPDPVNAGSNLTYTINFVNNGPSDAQTVTVSDAVPANTTFVSATVTTGTGWAVNTSGPIVFSKATVAAGETAVFTMVVKVNSNVANGSTISNSAVAASATTDTNSANNTGTATTTVQVQADLAVTKTDSPDPVVASQNLTYTINFVNNGPSDAQTVTVTDAVPANTTFVSATVTTGSGWSTNTAGPIVFSKATVAAGETAVFTIVVKVNANTPHNTTITNSATAASTTPDPTPGNNTGTATTTVIAQADLAVTKTNAPAPVVCANGNITYTINFVNNGPGPGLTTTVTDAVPANTTFVSASVTMGSGWATNTAGPIVFSKASVASGETATFQIVVKLNAGTPPGTDINNTVTAMSSIPDPTPTNNSAMATTKVDPILPTITCPAPIVVAAETGKCTAKVTFTPKAVDNCAVASVVCAPASGTDFPVGTTTVNCKATDTAGNMASCSFTVKVNDTQPPQLTCPANITAKTAQPGDSCVVVNYTTPAATDNCPLPPNPVVCTPASGSCFPRGTTTVTCTATDASGNTATCSFKVTVFDICLQDDSNPLIVVFVNSATGDYRYCCNGTVFTGKGKVLVQGNTFTMTHNTTDRRVLVTLEGTAHRGTANLQVPPGTTRCLIVDRDTRNNTCLCQ